VAVTLGAIEFNERVIKQQLRHDLLDDWFPDPRRFEDMLSGDHIESILAENFRKNDGVIRPEPRTLLNIPKSNFTLRYGLEISLAERALYQAIASRLVPFYDSLIPWNVFSHRASEDPAGRYLLRRAVRSWQDFIGVVRDALVGQQVLLSTDLANYFENINLERLRDTLVTLLQEVVADPAGKADIRAHIGTLFDCLKSWCYSPVTGLPQNRDASSFLANIYMLPVDRAMLAKGYRYYRYMDDIKIACGSEHDARKALKELSLALRERGLSVNSGKTAIVPTARPDDIAKCLDAGETELQQIDSIWQTRSLRPISRSFPLLSRLTQRLLGCGDIGSRAFRYCIRRLEVLASCSEFEVPEAYFAPITPLVIDALSMYPASTDELARYLRAVPTSAADLRQIADLLKDDTRNYYTWQSYRLWTLLVQKNHRDPDLVMFAMEVIKGQKDGAARCGATLYAGAFGSKEDRIEIAKRFGELTSFMGQRAALLAVQELHFKPHIRDNIAPRLRDDLKNVYRGLNRAGVYVAPPLPISITRILDAERDYD
jgi:hypothetical protein